METKKLTVWFDATGCSIVPQLNDELSLAFGFDKTNETIKLIKGGYLSAVVAQRQSLWGELVVRRLNDLINNRNIVEYEDTGTFEINKRNLSVFDK